jgi:hypothetical protein
VASRLAFHSAWQRISASLLYCSVACLSLRRLLAASALVRSRCCACISLRKLWTSLASAICRSAWYSFSLRFMRVCRSQKLRESTLLYSRMGRGELVRRRVGREDLLWELSADGLGVGESACIIIGCLILMLIFIDAGKAPSL